MTETKEFSRRMSGQYEFGKDGVENGTGRD